MTAMLETTANFPSMSSVESDYHRFNLHRLEEASKDAYGDNDESPQYSPEGKTYYRDSSPKLSFSDLEVHESLPAAIDKSEKAPLQSQEEASSSQSSDFTLSGSDPLVDGFIFGGETCTPTPEQKSQKETKILAQPTSRSHYANCAELGLLDSDNYGNGLYLQLDEHSPPLEVPVTSAKRTKSQRVATVRIPGTGKTVTRVRRAPRARKASTDKAEKPKVPKLDRPLSHLTESYHHLPVRDMESWVNRSESVRRAEVIKRGGYIARPMNSFMLYRSAYAERTKLWCLQNNHQVVSAVSGVSWPLEPEHIRCKYNELARIERVNHQSAHPGYKFSPSKSQTSRKRKGAKENEQSDPSDLEDLDDVSEYINQAGEKRKRPSKANKRQTKGTNTQQGSVTAHNTKYFDFSCMGEGGASRSSFAATNPGKTPPVCMGSTDMNGQYYQTTVHASRATPVPNGDAVIEDVTIQKTQGPGRQSNVALENPWVVSSMYTGSYEWSTEGLEEVMLENSKVDPALLVEDFESGNLGAFENPPTQCTMLDDIDEGFGSFDIDPLFQTDIEGAYQEMSTTQSVCEDLGDYYGTSPVDSAIDMHSLPAYHESMHGFIDDNEPWTVIKDEGTGAGLKYDEWLQE